MHEQHAQLHIQTGFSFFQNQTCLHVLLLYNRLNARLSVRQGHGENAERRQWGQTKGIARSSKVASGTETTKVDRARGRDGRGGGQRHHPVFQGGIWNRNHQGRLSERPGRGEEEDRGITNLPRRHLEPKPPRSTSERPDGERRRTEASLIFQGGIWNRNHQGRLVRGRDKEEDGDGRV